MITGMFRSSKTESASTTASQDVRHVIVAGAGPAGLLLSLLLLQRNDQTPNEAVKYKVTLLESRSDLGQLDPETDLKKHRSWMLGLAGHGLQALREIPELYNDYVNGVGIRLQSVSIHLGAKEIKSQAGVEGEANEGYIVDRNFIVAALSRFMNDKYSKTPMLETKYETKLLYVDSENQRVLVRSNNNNNDGEEEVYMDYDLLVGADGVRSVVREALVKQHYDFEMDVGDIFQCFKAVHVRRPSNVDPASMHLLPACFPLTQGIALPETGDMLNISIGVPRHSYDKLADELKCDDPAIVAEYFRKNFKAFELEDYDDFAKQWVAQRWNRTGQVHCNSYHSVPLKIIIMGDAAHATSPSIGMGMNTALRDAQALYRLLADYDDDLDQVLPAFSKARVKEGNALTDLAFHLYCFDNFHQLVETLNMVARGFLSKTFSWVSPHPQAIIGNPKYNLADVYDLSVKLGIISKHRAINDKVRREFFELETGMIREKRCSKVKPFTIAAISIGLVAFLCAKVI